MTSGDVIRDIHSRPKFGAGSCVRRMSHLLSTMLDSDWGRQLSVIKVTGSNGKGSVAAMLHALVRLWDPRAGRYTSPHLLRFQERIVIGDADIDDPTLVEAHEWVTAKAAELHREWPDERFGSFEWITAVAVRAFEQSGITTAVVEAGIGGRFDPTRLLPGDLVALTSVDLEHTELLGRSLEQIAYDKIDLCPDGGTVVTILRNDDLRDRVLAYCRLRRISLIDARSRWQVDFEGLVDHDDGIRMRVALSSGFRNIRADVPLVGTFQLDNIAIACTVLDEWLARRHHLVTEVLGSLIRQGLESVHWPCRFERISRQPPVYIDVAHTPDACNRLAETVRLALSGQSILLVTGVSSDKNTDGILKTLLPLADRVICTRASHKGAAVAEIEQTVRRLAFDGDLDSASTISEAVAMARSIAIEHGMTILVAGGLFLAVEFRSAWSGGDPNDLRFL